MRASSYKAPRLVCCCSGPTEFELWHVVSGGRAQDRFALGIGGPAAAGALSSVHSAFCEVIAAISCRRRRREPQSEVTRAILCGRRAR